MPNHRWIFVLLNNIQLDIIAYALL